MRMSRRLANLISLVWLVACSGSHPIEIEHAWIREINPSQSVTAGYLTMTNTGQTDDRLVSVSTAAYRVVELHTMSVDDRGVMKMRKSGPIAVSAGESVALRGSYHLMLIEPQYAITAGNDVPLTLVFEKSGETTVAARVRNE